MTEILTYNLQATYDQVVGQEAMSKPKGFYHVICDAKPDKAENAFCINGYAKAGEDGELNWVKTPQQKSCRGCPVIGETGKSTTINKLFINQGKLN